MRKWCAEDGRTVLWTLIGIGIGVIAGALDFLFASGLQLCTQLRTAYLWLLAPFLGLAGLLIVTLYRRYGQRAKRGMALVFVAGYLIIYNIFQISVTADIQFYGRLKTLGASTRQIRKLLYEQADRLCLAGIPAGLLLGWLLGMVLVPVLMGTAEQSSVSASPVIFIGSALFSWLTVLISCLRPARIAARISPVEALRMNDADGTVPSGRSRKTSSARSRKALSPRSQKARRHRPGNASLFSMALANLGRNKKRTVTVVCSLTLGLVLLSCFYAQNAAFDMEKYLADLTLADFELSEATSEDYFNGYDPHGTTLSADLVSRAESLDSAGADQLRDALDSGMASAILLGLDGIPLNTITQDGCIMAGSYDAQEFSTGSYVLVVGPSMEPGTIPDAIPAPTPGTKVTLNGQSYTVMAVVYPLNPVTAGASQRNAAGRFEMQFILPADVFRAQWPDHTLRKLFLNVDDAHLEEAQAFLDFLQSDEAMAVFEAYGFTSHAVSE